MKEIKQAVFNHLKMNSHGALLITGRWGAGKTYYLKNELFNEIEADKKLDFTPLMISLFGENDIKRLNTKIVQELYSLKGDSIFKTTNIFNGIKKLSNALPYFKKFVDPDELINLVGGSVFELLKTNKIALFFDDLERMGEGLKINDFLGYANDLSENKGCKIIIVANEEEINKKNDFNYKEKTISKTIVFSPDKKQVFNNVRQGYKSEKKVFDFLVDNEDFFIETLDPSPADIYDSLSALSNKHVEELSKDFDNIRSLKLALEHFKEAFSLVEIEEGAPYQITLKKFYNLWCFCLSVTIEMRKPDGLAYNKTKEIDELRQFYISLDLVLNNNKSDTSDDEELSFEEKFKKKYFERIGQPYFFYETLYNFITAGISIDKVKLNLDLNQNFKLEDNKVSPQYEVYQEFMSVKRSQFLNEEFPKKLDALFNYTNEGLYQEYTEYVNNAVYLLGFKEYFEIPKSKGEIIDAISTGINTLTDRIGYNQKWEMEKDLFSDFKETPEVHAIIDYINEIVEHNKKGFVEKEVELLEAQLLNSPLEFRSTFLKDKNLGVLTQWNPIFKYFNPKKIIERIQNWEAQDIAIFSNILDKRYLKTGDISRLDEEFENVLEVLDFIIAYKPPKKNYSNYYLENSLLPTAEKVKLRIQESQKYKEGI